MNRLRIAACLLAGLALLGLAGPVHAQKKDAPATEGEIDKVAKALPEKAPAEPKAKHKILVFSKTMTYRHDSIPIGTKAIEMMGDKTGAYVALVSEDPSMFAPDKLKMFDAVVFLNSTGECLNPKTGNKDADKAKEEEHKKALEDFVLSGKGLMGIHAGGDTYNNWTTYNKMMGTSFISHPWTAGTKVSVKNLEPSNPLNAGFGGKDFDITDEIYQFKAGTALASERLYLLQLDTDKMGASAKGDGRTPPPYPISWASTYGKGRTFYCSLGHNKHIFQNPMVLQHYLAGLQYVLGDLDAPHKDAPIAK